MRSTGCQDQPSSRCQTHDANTCATKTGFTEWRECTSPAPLHYLDAGVSLPCTTPQLGCATSSTTCLAASGSNVKRRCTEASPGYTLNTGM